MVYLFIALEGNTQLEKLLEYGSKVLKELVFILGVQVKVFLELLVVVHGNFSRQHHDICVVLINPLPAAVLQVLLDPFASRNSLEIFIGKDGGGLLPWTFKSTAVRVTTTQSMSTS